MNTFKNMIVGPVLSIALTANSVGEWVKSFVTRIAISLDFLFSPNIYIFFDKYPAPFPARSLRLESVHSAKPSILYNADALLFFPQNNETGSPHIEDAKSSRLPLLSLEIIDLDLTVIFDLTDYIERARYIRQDSTDCPTISEIVMGWSVSAGLILDSDKYRVRYITNDGDTMIVSITDTSELEQVTTTDPSPSPGEKPHAE